MTFRFTEGQSIDPATLSIDPTKPSGIQIASAGADRHLQHQGRRGYHARLGGLGDSPNDVIVRFAQDLPDNTYQVTFVGQASYTGPDGNKVRR